MLQSNKFMKKIRAYKLYSTETGTKTQPEVFRTGVGCWCSFWYYSRVMGENKAP